MYVVSLLVETLITSTNHKKNDKTKNIKFTRESYLLVLIPI